MYTNFKELHKAYGFDNSYKSRGRRKSICK